MPILFEQVEQWPNLPFKFFQNDPREGIDYPAHWHPGIELNFLVAGAPLTFTANGVPYRYHPGDCWATDRRVIHNASGDSQATWDEFGFIIDETFLAHKLPSSGQWQVQMQGDQPRQAHPEAYQAIYDHGLAIRDLIAAGVDEYRRLAILSHFYALLIELGQHFTTSVSQTVTANPHLVDQVMATINRDYAQPLHGPALAEAAHVSLTTLNQQFQAHLQLTVGGYLRLVRLLNARRLLIETTSSIDYIAAVCGFGSTKSFQRNFKTWTGQSPAQFREQPTQKP